MDIVKDREIETELIFLESVIENVYGPRQATVEMIDRAYELSNLPYLQIETMKDNIISEIKARIESILTDGKTRCSILLENIKPILEDIITNEDLQNDDRDRAKKLIADFSDASSFYILNKQCRILLAGILGEGFSSLTGDTILPGRKLEILTSAYKELYMLKTSP